MEVTGTKSSYLRQGLNHIQSLTSKSFCLICLIFQIVSNYLSGIDVDKCDYFARDALNLGIKSNFPTDRYIDSLRIIDQVAVYDDEQPVKRRKGLPHLCPKRSVSVNDKLIIFDLCLKTDQMDRSKPISKADFFGLLLMSKISFYFHFSEFSVPV